MAKTRAQQNRAIRQEALREQLAAQGHVQHVIDCADKIGKLDSSDESSSFDLQKYRTKAELHLKLANKYLPDLKSQEVEMTVEERRSIDEYSIGELAALARGSEAGDRASDGGSREPSDVH